MKVVSLNDRKKKEEDDLFLKQFQRDEPDYFKTDNTYHLVKHIDCKWIVYLLLQHQ